MASSGYGLPHSKTELVMTFRPDSYGPLCNVACQGRKDPNNERELGAIVNTFQGGTYHVTRVKEDFELYRYYGGRAREFGQYWSVDPLQSNPNNLSYRNDAAVLHSWNTLENVSKLVVPKGLLLYEGYTSGQVERGQQQLGGGWQIYIPKVVLEPLVKANQLIRRGDALSAAEAMNEVSSAQAGIITEWHKEYMKRTSEYLQRNLEYGSENRYLPKEIRSMLAQKGEQASSKGSVPREMVGKKYVVHREPYYLPMGGTGIVTVSVEINFVRSETRQYMSGNTRVTETTNYYQKLITIAYG